MNENAIKDLLKNIGLKITENRIIISKIILDSFDHMTVEQVLLKAKKINPSIGLATVYRTLNSLEKESLIKKHIFAKNIIAYENILEKHRHDHLIDIDNKNVIEFTNGKLEKLLNDIAKNNGYELLYHDLKLYGKKRS
ncbi:MAG: transcriptional repressor [Alphaproteobacteria bacterium]|jgi:Fur family ferric uptake transcriptional regulator|nr:transcriptional repressor [Alphaproteobacteria bacterium]